MFIATYNPYKHDTRLEIGRFTKSIKDPSFPYLERASQTTLTLRRMSTKVLGADLRGEQNDRNDRNERGLAALGALYTL